MSNFHIQIPNWDRLKKYNRIIIVGSRNFKIYKYLEKKLDYYLKNLKPNIAIISGTARGADHLGEIYSNLRKYELIQIPANWEKFGKMAGYLRNIEMARIATHAVLFWDCKSKGTENMIDIAKLTKIPYRIVDIGVFKMEFILIKNEQGNYSKWRIYDYDKEKKCYHIELDQDKAIISCISKTKLIERDGNYYSDEIKPIKEVYDFAFTPFRTIKI